MLMEFDPSSLVRNEAEQAQTEMADFLQTEIERVIDELTQHKNPIIQSEIINRVRLQLENTSTVVIHEDAFSIYRSGSNGFRTEWHHDHQQAA